VAQKLFWRGYFFNLWRIIKNSVFNENKIFLHTDNFIVPNFLISGFAGKMKVHFNHRVVELLDIGFVVKKIRWSIV